MTGRSSMVLCVVAMCLIPSRAALSQASSSSSHAAPQRLATVSGLAAPEAVSYDAALGVYFVSNINGQIGAKDGNGFITRIRSDGQLDSLHFIQGGRDGVTLNGPMGSRIKGDTLWVLDIDVLRAFDARTGKALVTIGFAPLHPLLLNDLAIGPHDDFYITDTGVRPDSAGELQHTGPDRIYHVGRDRKPTIALESAALTAPDGIDWDPSHSRLLLAPIGGTAIQSWVPGASAPVIVAPGKGRFDGIEVERDGTVLITSWADSSVESVEGDKLVRRIGGFGSPADVTYDAARHRVGVVLLQQNRFELWTLP
jgi:sugar lactone lactonase YvrE